MGLVEEIVSALDRLQPRLLKATVVLAVGFLPVGVLSALAGGTGFSVGWLLPAMCCGLLWVVVVVVDLLLSLAIWLSSR